MGLGDHSRKREKIAAVVRAVQRFLALLTGVVLLAGCGADRQSRVLRLGHGLDPTHPVHRAMEAFADEVEAASAGSLQVRIYPSEQLGSERECLELLQIGSLDLTKVSAAVLESFAPAFRVLSLPYLFVDQEHRFRVLGGEIGESLLRQPRDARLLGLAYYDAGSRSFYTRDHPITSPEDLQGLKIRTQESATAMDMVRALGGSPTPISWGELYTALQQGVVDGAENNPPSFHLSRHYEIARYYTTGDRQTSRPTFGRAAENSVGGSDDRGPASGGGRRCRDSPAGQDALRPPGRGVAPPLRRRRRGRRVDSAHSGGAR